MYWQALKLREIQERITSVSPATVRVQGPIEFNHVTPASANGLTAAADLAAARQAIQSAEAAASAAVAALQEERQLRLAAEEALTKSQDATTALSEYLHRMTSEEDVVLAEIYAADLLKRAEFKKTLDVQTAAVAATALHAKSQSAEVSSLLAGLGQQLQSIMYDFKEVAEHSMEERRRRRVLETAKASAQTRSREISPQYRMPSVAVRSALIDVGQELEALMCDFEAAAASSREEIRRRRAAEAALSSAYSGTALISTELQKLSSIVSAAKTAFSEAEAAASASRVKKRQADLMAASHFAGKKLIASCELCVGRIDGSFMTALAKAAASEWRTIAVAHDVAELCGLVAEAATVADTFRLDAVNDVKFWEIEQDEKRRAQIVAASAAAAVTMRTEAAQVIVYAEYFCLIV